MLRIVWNMVRNMESTQMPQKRESEENAGEINSDPEEPVEEVLSGSLEGRLLTVKFTPPEIKQKTADLKRKYRSLRSSTDEYKILEFLGEGGFGKVAKCLKKGSNEVVAVKILKSSNIADFTKETLVLRKLSSDNPDKFNFVRNVENFIYKKHCFMAFEMLDKSLWDYVVQGRRQPLPMEGIRFITHQLVVALKKLKDLRIIHGDLKPSNIMLVNHKREPFRIKIIDFGLCIPLPSRFYHFNLGAITYRAPEITLGLPYSEAVDMWSTGCIVAEMLVGHVLYPSRSPYDQIRFIEETQGPFPDDMLLSKSIVVQYFCQSKVKDRDEWKWRVKSPSEYQWDTGNMSTDIRKYPLKNLDDLLEVCSHVRREYGEEDVDRKYCVDMIKKMLEISHQERILPKDALGCEFIRCGNTSTN